MTTLHDTESAANYLTNKGTPVSANTLRFKRTKGGGPRFRKFGRFVIYEETALDDWHESQLSEPRLSTSQAA